MYVKKKFTETDHILWVIKETLTNVKELKSYTL
jgi:hypothetical protein